MSALMGLIFVAVMLTGALGWIAERFDLWRLHRAQRAGK